MPTPSRTFCRPEAYELLAAQVPVIESADALLRAAVAVSMHEQGDPHLLARVERGIDDLAATIRERVRGPQPQAMIAHAHQVLFDEHGFYGDTEDYYRPENSYIARVLDRKRGLPIALCLIYKLVLERCGLRVLGINAPGHFLVSVELHGAELIVDPFFGGAALSEREALERVAQVTGQSLAGAPDHMIVASHRRWILRMLRNLRAMFARRRRHEDQAAMVELARLLGDA